MREDEAHAARARVYQYGVALLHRVRRLDQVVRGHALEQGRGGHFGADAFGHVGAEIGWGDAVFGVGPLGLGGDDPISDLQRRDVLADRLDGAAHLGAEDERHLPRILPRPEVGVEEVHADGVRLDQYLPGAGGGLLFST